MVTVDRWGGRGGHAGKDRQRRVWRNRWPWKDIDLAILIWHVSSISLLYVTSATHQDLTMNLLPKHHDEFKSKEYWNKFFEERGKDAFEWYGSYKDISNLCIRNIRKMDRILQIGCGNSSFSADLYDGGFKNITNVDFSEPVIVSMREQNSASRADMEWAVMDMTDLTYPDDSFDVVLDKGALDALMSNDSEESRAQATAMFASITRVLRSGGRYMCITLAEHFILEHLMRYFLGNTGEGLEGMGGGGDGRAAFHIQMDVCGAAVGTSSPFLPFLVVVTKNPQLAIHSPSSLITCMFDAFGVAVKTRQQAQIVSVHDLLPLVLNVQKFSQKKFDLSVVRPGERFEVVDIHSTDPALTIPRFSIIVYDYAVRAPRSAAVFFVPLGRETEYQFSTPGGLATVAEQAGCRRLLVVRCNRPHEFPAMDQLQAELSPVAMSLAPGDMGHPDQDRIPFVALDSAAGWERVASGHLEKAGMYHVEETCSSDCYRRLIFLENQQFVQTEIRLVLAAESTGGKKSGNKVKAKGKKKKHVDANSSRALTAQSLVAPSVDSLLRFDDTYLDDHHRAMLVAYLVGDVSIVQTAYSRGRGAMAVANVDTPPPPPSTAAAQQTSPDLSAEVSASWLPSSTPIRPPATLLIGLGGGALAMAIQRYLPNMHLDVVELVPGLEDVAKEHFGFVRGSKCRVLVADGLEAVRSMQRLNTLVPTATCPYFAYDHIIVDVDGKDVSSADGLSAPPQEFVSPDFLTCLHSLLKGGGVLSINVVCRNAGIIEELCAQLSSTFTAVGHGAVYRISPSTENVNITLHASTYTAPSATASGGAPSKGSGGKAKKGKADSSGSRGMSSAQLAAKKMRQRELDDWLQGIHLSNDPLELEALVGVIETL